MHFQASVRPKRSLIPNAIAVLDGHSLLVWIATLTRKALEDQTNQLVGEEKPRVQKLKEDAAYREP